MINLNEGFSPLKSTKFKPGQIVAHLKYSYRGLVVESDESCEADEIWYHSQIKHKSRTRTTMVSFISGWQSTCYICSTIKP